MAAPGGVNANWVTVLEHHADRFPDKALVTFQGRTTTYSQMLASMRQLATGLRDLGVGQGDVVGVLASNRPEFIEIIFAANQLGAIAMPINSRLAAREVAYIIENSRAKVLFSDAQLAETATAALLHAAARVQAIHLDDVATDGWMRVSSVRSEPPHTDCARVSGHDLHRLMYTSGTTSHPKGVMMSHANLVWKNMSHIVEFGFSPTDVGLVCGPMYHVGALDATVTTLIHAGASVIIHPRFSAEDVVRELANGGVTNVWLAPSMINAILALQDVDSFDLSSVRLIISGGEKMPEPLIKRLEVIFPNAWFADGYGLTEGVSADTILDRRKTLEKLGSVGKPCLFVELDIWDEFGNPVGPGVPGEIVLRGPKLFKGYWENEEATRRAFRGGWFHTEDVGYRDDDGYLYIVDRLKDMIISGGENIASLEVERVLYQHPAVAETAVVGRPHERWGEVPCAFVVLKPSHSATRDELDAHCREHLASYKVPKDVVFMDALPRNLSGKVLKRTLRDLAQRPAP